MKRVCAWCGKDMGEKPPLDNTSTTHGMCQDCADEARKERQDQEKEFNNGETNKG